MARGGYRAGAGRPRGTSTKDVVQEAKREAKKANMSPLEYMLSVMNDGAAEVERRDRMAQAAAPYVHAKAADAAPGKKEQRQAEAEKAAGGKFAVPTAPKLVVNNPK
jgi:hypothetical protein